MSRGRAQATLDLIDVMHQILADIQPASVRAACYQLFIRKLLRSMAKGETNKVSRLLTIARDEGAIPWDWIVDETREAERPGTWSDPEDFAAAVIRSYRRDYWLLQPIRIEVWSEKGTVRGTLKPVLDHYGVTFRALHGYNSTTVAHDVGEETAEEPLTALYVGDWDPSGMHMSEVDLPRRVAKYGGKVELIRLAITARDRANSGLPQFAAKPSDPRYKWFVSRYGTQCIELDALDPRELRERVRFAIHSRIDQAAWRRCKIVEAAEQQSLIATMRTWNGTAAPGGAS